MVLRSVWRKGKKMFELERIILKGAARMKIVVIQKIIVIQRMIMQTSASRWRLDVAF